MTVGNECPNVIGVIDFAKAVSSRVNEVVKIGVNVTWTGRTRLSHWGFRLKTPHQTPQLFKLGITLPI